MVVVQVDSTLASPRSQHAPSDMDLDTASVCSPAPENAFPAEDTPSLPQAGTSRMQPAPLQPATLSAAAAATTERVRSYEQPCSNAAFA